MEKFLHPHSKPFYLLLFIKNTSFTYERSISLIRECGGRNEAFLFGVCECSGLGERSGWCENDQDRHAAPESSPIHQSLLFFEERLESRSSGDIEVEIFPEGNIGGVKEMTELVQSGNITMTTGASVHLSSAVAELAVLDQFLLFQD
ncbi:MAG: hypothetical protein K5905_18015 [Roseibium sp.]|uniref:hypothetical protein n=1 Tax=Roseibium sp. TaxID=1936156 RepID=UPI002618A063|nr:hypothetical protein [Roseibium sp.]MCV0427361.1 hypothetical protein [Roseibium sp.]